MLHRNAAQAAEDGPSDFCVWPADFRPPTEPGADPNHNLHDLRKPQGA
jgi:hypothetical protein